MPATFGCWRSASMLPHIHNTRHTEVGTGGGSGDSVLTGSRLGDHSCLPHPLCQEHLAERIVDLMCTELWA